MGIAVSSGHSLASLQNDPGGSHASENCRRSLSFPGEWKKIRAIFEGAGNNFKPFLDSMSLLHILASEKKILFEKNSASQHRSMRMGGCRTVERGGGEATFL